MTNLSLKTDVEIILEKSTLVGGYDVKVPGGALAVIQGGQQVIIPNPEEYELINSQVNYLKKLFFQSNKPDQQEIIETLLTSIGSTSEITKTASITVLEIGSADKLIEQIKNEFNSHTQINYFFAVNTLNGYIYFFWPRFTLNQIRELRKWAQEVKNGVNVLGEDAKAQPQAYWQILTLIESIYKQTTHILAGDVEKRIDTGFNPQINEDKEELKKEVSRFGFPTDLSETLDKIDLKFSQAHDAFDFKGCMDLIRAFTERLYRSILDTYGEKGKKVDEKDSEKVAKFFEEEGLVSDHFATMVAQFRHFLSDQGSHRLKSREEDARLTKNMVIEMSLYLLRRFENH